MRSSAKSTNAGTLIDFMSYLYCRQAENNSSLCHKSRNMTQKCVVTFYGSGSDIGFPLHRSHRANFDRASLVQIGRHGYRVPVFREYTPASRHMPEQSCVQ